MSIGKIITVHVPHIYSITGNPLQVELKYKHLIKGLDCVAIVVIQILH